MADKYMVLIMEPQWDEDAATQEDWANAMRAHNAFADAVRAAGQSIESSEALASGRNGVKIQPAADGSTAQFTDGPFGETKELVSGFYVITAESKEQAKELAALCPTGGWIELYPVIDVSQF